MRKYFFREVKILLKAKKKHENIFLFPIDAFIFDPDTQSERAFFHFYSFIKIADIESNFYTKLV